MIGVTLWDQQKVLVVTINANTRHRKSKCLSFVCQDIGHRQYLQSPAKMELVVMECSVLCPVCSWVEDVFPILFRVPPGLMIRNCSRVIRYRQGSVSRIRRSIKAMPIFKMRLWCITVDMVVEHFFSIMYIAITCSVSFKPAKAQVHV